MAINPYGSIDEGRAQSERDAQAAEAELKQRMAGVVGLGGVPQAVGQIKRNEGERDVNALIGANYGGSYAASQAEAARLRGVGDLYQGMGLGSWDQGQGSRGSQQDALSLMQSAAYGNAPSVAAMQQQQGLNAAIASQQAMAAGARGPGGLAMGQYNAAANTGALQQGSIGQAAMLRAQEMAQARGAYGELAGGIRAQDIASAIGQGQMGLGYEGIGQRAQLANMQGHQAAAGLAQQQMAQQEAADAQRRAEQMSNITAAVGAGAGLIAAIPTGGASLGLTAASLAAKNKSGGGPAPSPGPQAYQSPSGITSNW